MVPNNLLYDLSSKLYIIPISDFSNLGFIWSPRYAMILPWNYFWPLEGHSFTVYCLS